MRIRRILMGTVLLAGLVPLAVVSVADGVGTNGADATVAQTPDPTPEPKSRAAASGEKMVSAELAAGASAFVPISAYRMYDSRTDPAGIWIEGDNFLIDALTDNNGTPQIPATATAVAFNVTVTQTVGAGFVQIYGPGTVPYSTSTVNWVASGIDIANSGSSQLGSVGPDPGLMGVALGGNGAAAHIIIDITGYYEAITT